MPKKGQTKPPEQMHSKYKKMRINGRQVSVHRYIMEQMLGRPLDPGEIVHHINGDRYDNRPENLMLISPKDHSAIHNKGRPLSDECKRKVSQSLIGNKRRKGIPHTPEMREHLRQTSRAARQRKFWSTRKNSE